MIAKCYDEDHDHADDPDPTVTIHRLLQVVKRLARRRPTTSSIP